jgi:menaquinone-dependent protoporphyrinogen oxidase
MKVLVTWGSKRGGTEGIATTIGAALQQAGHEVDLRSAREARKASGFDAVIVGGSLYAGRWHPGARRFVIARADDLRRVPVWFFSSGPLDDSANRTRIDPTPEVAALMASVGACDHVTFGGRLEPDARGFPASAMAKKRAGDWRAPDDIRAWATDVAWALPVARPRAAIPLPGRAPMRVVGHALGGWAACVSVMVVLLHTTTSAHAQLLHAVAVPLLFAAVARSYFRPAGAREPLPVGIAFAALAALFDLVFVALLAQRNLAMFASFTGTWLPLLLIVAVTWVTGEIMATVRSFPPAQGGHVRHA